MKILFCDKNKNVREFIRREFEVDGYEVLTAGKSNEILEQVKSENPPDILVVDPDIFLFENRGILTDIKNNAPDIPIIIYTVLADLLSNPILKDAKAFVEKTGDPETLKQAINNILKK